MTEAFAGWIGRSVERHDIAAAGPVARLAATLGAMAAPATEGVIPPLSHWLFHLSDAPRETLGRDGHPMPGGLLPPIEQPRRMWAGGRLRFLAPIRVGASLIKRTTIAAIVEKSGTNGPMTFIKLNHAIIADESPAVEEEQDLVYLPIIAPAPGRPVDVPAAASERTMTVDEALLFRFSALTFNAHRIHYDLAYARDVELYPGVVVHGPLQAMLLLNHAIADGLRPRTFAFRARSPLYATTPFTLAGAGPARWVRDARGAVTMTATVTGGLS